MKRAPEQIIKEITSLLGELNDVISGKSIDSRVLDKDLTSSNYSGATGGMRLLIEEGYFDQPRTLQEVMQVMEERGRYYPRPTVAMSLLNLVRERVLVRTKNNGKKWHYVLRK